MSTINLQIAMKAVIVHDDKVLILRESNPNEHNNNTHSGKYQLPGGRVEPGEAFSDALDREVLEETGLVVQRLYPILVGEWRPTIKGTPHQIVGVFFVCKADTDKIILSDEHDGFEWINPRNYKKFNILPPDWQAVARFAEGQERPI